MLRGDRHTAASDVYSFALVGGSPACLGSAQRLWPAVRPALRGRCYPTCTCHPATHPATRPPTPSQVLWELLTWQLPWAITGANVFQVVRRVEAGERPALPPPDQLPGGHDLPGLDDYCALMR